MRCGFSATRHEEEKEEVSLDGQVVPQNDTFRYLGSMLQKDGDIDEDVKVSFIIRRTPFDIWGQCCRRMVISMKM
jgi:hypothetical protein